VLASVEEAGTYFYHSHVGFQTPGCSGALIVEDAGASPVPYDEERRVFLSDYFNRADQNITKDLLANPLGWSGETNSLLVNGFSAHLPMRRPHVLQQSSVLSQTKPTDSENHTDLSIIEADGRYTQPFSTSHLQVGTGQRFSVLLKTMSAVELDSGGKTDIWIQLENRERPPPMVRSYAVLSYSPSGPRLRFHLHPHSPYQTQPMTF
jgi:L-ascorbate oxidase